jgi:hypothetical protein
MRKAVPRICAALPARDPQITFAQSSQEITSVSPQLIRTFNEPISFQIFQTLICARDIPTRQTP